jgi:energy-coupling factor transporter ATP-binding protein EcfA2
MEKNIQFELACEFIMNTHQCIFITGKAGTGKTTLLKHLQKSTLKNTMVAAPTGIAAIQAGGVTIHSLFQLPFSPIIPFVQGRLEDHPLVQQMKLTKAKRTLLNELELLIIDEVSMVRADVLDGIDIVLRAVRKNPHIPFGGVQVVYFGDLYQLPPVIKANEWQQSIGNFYESGFIFDSKAFKQSPPIIIELEKIYRQTDIQFIDLLNRIRLNQLLPEDIDAINKHYFPGFTAPSNENYITLTALNAAADKINQQQLELLSTPAFHFEGSIEGDFPSHALPTDLKLTLKEGAQVMFIKNDKGEERRYYNGKLAQIEKISDAKIWIKLLDNGYTFELEKEEWINIRYSYDEKTKSIKEEELGSFKQYPLKLAWAITIHKSQGLTFEKAIIDAGDAFAAGQVYVALSRLSNKEGLVLNTRISRSSITVEERVVRFYQRVSHSTELQNLLNVAKKRYLTLRLVEAFDWKDCLIQWDDFVEEVKHLNLPDKQKEMLWVLETDKTINFYHNTGKNFIAQISHALQTEKSNNFEWIKERLLSGCAYYRKKLVPFLEDWYQHIEQQPEGTDSFYLKFNTQQYQQAFLIEKKLEFLEQLLAGFIQESDLLKWNEQALRNFEASDVRLLKYTGKKGTSGTSGKTSIDLFIAGTSIGQIAQFRGIKESTVYSHLAEGVEQGKIQAEKLVPKNDLEKMVRLIKEHAFVSLKETKDYFGEEHSYEQIKIAMAYIKRQEALNN